MATSVDVNVKIGSIVGATKTGGGFPSGRPNVTTTLTLDGEIGGAGLGDIPLLSINTFTPFISYANVRSPQQDVSLTNIGNAVLTITNVSFSLRGNTRPIFYWTPSVALYNTFTNTASTITILPGTTATFKLAYIGQEVGEHSNYLRFASNSVSGDYKVNTVQQIGPDVENFDLSATEFISTTTVFGQQARSGRIDIIPTVNGAINTSFPVVSFSTAIEGDPGWSVVSTGTNSFELMFDPDFVFNATGTYYSTLTVTVSGNSRTIDNTAYIDIDYSKYRNLATWMSAPSANNSIVGMSLDLINDVKTLTIGVGIGANGSPGLAEGGLVFAQVTNLGISASTIERLYPYWTNVYAIPLEETPSTYLSGALDANDNPLYVRKATAGYNYADYFGNEQGLGSIFKVDYNGSDSIAVSINNLRDVSGDPEFDVTLHNLTRAFHYYSAVDTNRYYQLEPLSNDTSVTRLFRGFISGYFEGATTWSVDVSTVALPT
jgi:hypothetical protein